MGVKGLYSYLRGYRNQVNVNTLENVKTIGVDGLSILYKFRGNAEKILEFLKPFRDKDIKIVFVFDGKAPEEKREEVEQRKEKREAANDQATSIREFLQQENVDEKTRVILERKIHELEFGAGWFVTREIRHHCQDILRRQGIESMKAKGEADDVLISMWREGSIQAIISADMDFMVAGVSNLFIPTNGGQAEYIHIQKVLELEEISFRQFQEAAILCMNNIYANKAFTWIRHYKSIENIKNKHPHLCTLEKDYIESMIQKFNGK
jgi:5'-3' exonuclease